MKMLVGEAIKLLHPIKVELRFDEQTKIIAQTTTINGINILSPYFDTKVKLVSMINAYMIMEIIDE